MRRSLLFRIQISEFGFRFQACPANEARKGTVRKMERTNRSCIARSPTIHHWALCKVQTRAPLEIKRLAQTPAEIARGPTAQPQVNLCGVATSCTGRELTKFVSAKRKCFAAVLAVALSGSLSPPCTALSGRVPDAIGDALQLRATHLIHV